MALGKVKENREVETALCLVTVGQLAADVPELEMVIVSEKCLILENALREFVNGISNIEDCHFIIYGIFISRQIF